MCQPSRRCLCSGALSLRVLPLIAVRRFIAKLQPSLTGYRNQEFMLGCSRTKQMKNALYVVNHKSNCVACVQGNKASFCLDPTNYSYFKIIYQEIKISLFHLLLLFFYIFSTFILPSSEGRAHEINATRNVQSWEYCAG